jgi:uncharacterized membrane protein YkoI
MFIEVSCGFLQGRGFDLTQVHPNIQHAQAKKRLKQESQKHIERKPENHGYIQLLEVIRNDAEAPHDVDASEKHEQVIGDNLHPSILNRV